VHQYLENQRHVIAAPCVMEKTPMIMRFVNFSRFAALLVAGLGFSAVPAAAQWCGGCYTPVVVQPVYYGCGCCGCGSAYYGGYYAAAYAAGYGYADYAPRVYAPRVYAPRVRWAGPRYWGPRRVVARY
jgi:hypothetical protein